MRFQTRSKGLPTETETETYRERHGQTVDTFQVLKIKNIKAYWPLRI